MRETLLVQRHVLDRHPMPPDIDRKRDAHLQSTYEYLGLNTDGPASYKDHEALRPLTVVPSRVSTRAHALPSIAPRCLVLGGGGFLGGHLVEALQDAGFPCGSSIAFPDARQPPTSRRVHEWYEGDFGNRGDVAVALDGCDVAFHLVATTLPRSSNEDPVHDLESQPSPDRPLLGCCRGVRREEGRFRVLGRNGLRHPADRTAR